MMNDFDFLLAVGEIFTLVAYGQLVIESAASGQRTDAEQIGVELADDLLSQGAKTILDKLYQEG